VLATVRQSAGAVADVDTAAIQAFEHAHQRLYAVRNSIGPVFRTVRWSLKSLPLIQGPPAPGGAESGEVPADWYENIEDMAAAE
jgi:hypothetical protein